MPMLHLMVGIPCAGKTTRAKQLEAELPAVRLTPDDWHRALFGQDVDHPDHNARHARIEGLLWTTAAAVLERGIDVILDFGFWRRQERDDYRQRAADLGAASVIHFLDVSDEVVFARLAKRNEMPADAVSHIPEQAVRKWIGCFQRPAADELATPG